jgi:hypothetical protein
MRRIIRAESPSKFAPGPREFASDIIAIKTLAVSSDGRLIAVGNGFGAVEVWELL